MAKASSSKKKQIVTEDNIIDFVFQTLYTHLHVNELHFTNDILTPSGLQMTDIQVEHLRELIINTGLINASIGFKKNGYIYLNQSGIQVMKHHKSYTAFLAAGKAPAQPHITIAQTDGMQKTKPTSPKNKAKAKKKA